MKKVKAVIIGTKDFEKVKKIAEEKGKKGIFWVIDEDETGNVEVAHFPLLKFGDEWIVFTPWGWFKKESPGVTLIRKNSCPYCTEVFVFFGTPSQKIKKYPFIHVEEVIEEEVEKVEAVEMCI